MSVASLSRRAGYFFSVKTIGLILALVLAASLFVFYYTQRPAASSNVYLPDPNDAIHILPNGDVSIPASSAASVPITRSGSTYTFTANVPWELIIQKSNIVVNGEGFTLGQANAANNYQRIDLSGVSNVTIRDVNVQYFYYSIRFDQASNNTVVNCTASNILFVNSQGNTVYNCSSGKISFVSSSDNTVSNCVAAEFGFQDADNNRILRNNSTMTVGNDLYLVNSSNNLFFGNCFGQCMRWIGMVGTSTHNIFVANNVTAGNYTQTLQCTLTGNNTFYNNNFNNLMWNETLTSNSSNMWSYNGQGNYWSNYKYVPFYENKNGVGAIPYVIDENNVDDYPLLAPVNIYQQQMPTLNQLY